MSDLPETGWDAAAQRAVDEMGWKLPLARDFVIGFFLAAGDMRPFSDWVLRGHKPSERVMKAVALMMCESVPDDVSAALPFALVRKRRVGGRKNSRPNPELAVRDWFLAENVRAQFIEPGQYEAAIQAVSEMGAIGRQTVRDAYDKKHSRRLR